MLKIWLVSLCTSSFTLATIFTSEILLTSSQKQLTITLSWVQSQPLLELLWLSHCMCASTSIVQLNHIPLSIHTLLFHQLPILQLLLHMGMTILHQCKYPPSVWFLSTPLSHLCHLYITYCHWHKKKEISLLSGSPMTMSQIEEILPSLWFDSNHQRLPFIYSK